MIATAPNNISSRFQFAVSEHRATGRFLLSSGDGQQDNDRFHDEILTIITKLEGR